MDCGTKVCRDRKMDPAKCAKGSFRTIVRGKTHIVICCPKGKFNPKKRKRLKSGRRVTGACTVSMKTQSIVRPLGSPKCRAACKVR